jgi:hypothetical protein
MSLTVISDGLGQIAGMRSIRQSVQNGHLVSAAHVKMAAVSAAQLGDVGGDPPH